MKKKPPTKAEKEHLGKVAALGCIVCTLLRLGHSPSEVHHIRDGYGTGQRASHYETLPLCPNHHRIADGTAKFKYQVAYHRDPAEFEFRYGSERKLLTIVMERIYGNNQSRSA